MDEITALKERIRLLEEENARLRGSDEKNLKCGGSDSPKGKNSSESSGADAYCNANVHGESKNASFQGILEPEQIERYSRQLLLNQGFGVEGQQKLLKS